MSWISSRYHHPSLDEDLSEALAKIKLSGKTSTHFNIYFIFTTLFANYFLLFVKKR